MCWPITTLTCSAAGGRTWLAYAQREAAGGSAFARDCIRQSEIGKPSSHDAIFHNFSFAFVGRRDAAGQFICREEFYSLSVAFYRAYQESIAGYLLEFGGRFFPLQARSLIRSR